MDIEVEVVMEEIVDAEVEEDISEKVVMEEIGLEVGEVVMEMEDSGIALLDMEVADAIPIQEEMEFV